MRYSKLVLVLLLIALVTGVVAGCTEKNSPAAPTAPTPPPTPPKLTAPAPESPADDEQLGTLRPTLTVANGTSDQTGTRTYEFQISDKSDFSTLGSSFGTTFPISVGKTGVAEGSGTTAFGVEEGLQPTTRFYWRARMVQGTVTSDWSSTRRFRTRLVGYNKPGELYDPLIHGETLGTRLAQRR